MLCSKQGREEKTAKAQAQGTLMTGQLPRLTPRCGQCTSLQCSILAGATGREGAASQEISWPWQKGS